MGIGQGVVALLWREWGAFEANVLANVDVILRVGSDTNQTFLQVDFLRFFGEIKYLETSSKGRTIVDRSGRTCQTT